MCAARTGRCYVNTRFLMQSLLLRGRRSNRRFLRTGMLFLFFATVAGLLRHAQARFFATRNDAFGLLTGAPARLLSAWPATFTRLVTAESALL
jgi:hypothetical protein